MLGETLRDPPAGVESAGHQWLLRAGYVRQLAQGIFSYLALGQRTMQRIEGILRAEMTAIGGVEISMPVVQPAEIWERTGRYDSVGPELTRLRDRRDRALVLAMTHEEVVATLAATEITSHRQLPKLVFQIQTKWRDDPRPRAGLIRTREFTMEDSYSLDADDAGLDAQYRAHAAAYATVFRRCGLPVVVVGSDAGMMGGTESHEYMYLADVGEDTVVLCDGCGYARNRQVAASRKAPSPEEPPRAVARLSTPGASTIEQLCASLGVPAWRTAKTILLTAHHHRPGGTTHNEPVVVVLRGDTTLNEAKLAALVGGAAFTPMTGEEVTAAGAVAGYASPVGLTGVRIVADALVLEAPNLVAGANEPDAHLANVNIGRDWRPAVAGDVVNADAGDGCATCGSPLRTARGVEVANTFKLGTRYADALGARYLDPDGATRPVVMGSYGIGVSRLLACVAEAHHDTRGLRWPAAVSPFHVHLTTLVDPDSPARAVAERAYRELEASGIDVLFDDRGERPGVQFADADLIGVPLRLTVSRRSLDAGGIEVKARGHDEASVIAEDALVGSVARRWSELTA